MLSLKADTLPTPLHKKHVGPSYLVNTDDILDSLVRKRKQEGEIVQGSSQHKV